MAGRGAQTFKKRQREQQRKEKQQEKFAKRLERKRQSQAGGELEPSADSEQALSLQAEDAMPEGALAEGAQNS